MYNNEPDILFDYYKNNKFFILRNNSMGFLCGYVDVSHYPLFCTYYSNMPARELECHGGLTFSGIFDPVFIYEHHKSFITVSLTDFKQFFNNTYWVGFDCGHYNDLQPYIDIAKSRSYIFNSSETIYRDMNYVVENCHNLIDQIQKPLPYKFYITVDNFNNFEEWCNQQPIILNSSDTVFDYDYIATNNEEIYLYLKLALEGKI